MTDAHAENPSYENAIAIIGMAGRFPGAPDIDTFWRNIAAGVRSIRHFSDEELLAAGVDPALLRDPSYIKAGTQLNDYDRFDAAFFGYPPREAEIIDPQHRLFLETAWHALEDAAYNPETYSGLIGVFAGSVTSSYAFYNLAAHPELIEIVGGLQVHINNEVDSLASTVSYKLNLRGPSMAIQTFCSTSLVSVHMACQSLLTYECDIALAGGAVVTVPHGVGYTYQEGGILSADGYCRTFDATASGSVMGNGVGVVALKRMDEALEDGDQIYAVIRGSAVNNDGIRKVGYTAPGMHGQSDVILAAMLSADVPPETINYIETHGTATALGDSIEIAAMIRAFQEVERQQFCAIGSAKPNIGHLDRASGVTGLIKAALALTNRQMPPSIDCATPNPEFDLPNSPFFVNTQLREWTRGETPRRAGVSSFGLGGTNAHVVLEEAPVRTSAPSQRPAQLLLLSAKTATALETMTDNLAAHLRANPQLALADVAYTLQLGRAVFNHRRVLVAHDRDDAIAALSSRDSQRLLTLQQVYRNRPVAFLLPGVGEHYPGMAAGLYHSEPTFQEALDECCALLTPLLGQDLRPLLTTPAAPSNGAGDLRALLGRAPQSGAQASPLHQTALAQPAVFAVEYALAQLLISWGVQPAALLGYSLGEYVAATLAGVLALSDALTLVAKRAQLIQELPSGAMLAVQQGEAALQPYLADGVELAIVNTPTMCVLGGPEAAIAAVEARLTQDGVACRRLATSHAFHTSMLAPVAAQLTALARTLQHNPPQTPYLSNVTGTWITAAQASDPAYWAQHMVQTVYFGAGVAALFEQAQQVLLEVGPGAGLTALVRQHPACGRERLAQVISTLPAQHEASNAYASLLGALGKLWQMDVPIQWATLAADEQRLRVRLPAYPFERQRYWIEGPTRAASTTAASTGKRPEVADWFYLPTWQPTALPAASASEAGSWLVLATPGGWGAQLAERLVAAGQPVIRVEPGASFAQHGPQHFSLRPDSRTDYEALLHTLSLNGGIPSRIAHLWSLDSLPESFDRTGFQVAQRQGYYSLLALGQALGEQELEQTVQLVVLSPAAQAANGREALVAEHAPLVGLCKVITQELLMLQCRSVDIELPISPAQLGQLVTELQTNASEPNIAYRDGQRLALDYRAERLTATQPPLRQGGVYLITGGLGGVGLLLAQHLAQRYGARLALVGRSALPERAAWQAWLAGHAEDDRTSARIRALLAIEAAGGSVLPLHADVADPTELAAAIAAAEAQFGALHGVLHAAGISGDGSLAPLEALTAPQVEAHFQPKVYGLYALEAALGARALDFCLLFSSLASVLGGLGFGAYTAANAFIDGFAHRHNRTSPQRWVSINWDTWHLREGQHDLIGQTVAQYEMLPHEGAAAFEQAISAPAVSQIVNSTGDLHARIRQWVLLESLQQRPTRPLTSHARPELETAYIAPSGDYEGRIAVIWQDVLGIAQVGIDDNFFDLGGNSLIGLQVVAALKREFKAQVPVVALFEAPTVRALAQYLRPSLPQETNAKPDLLAQRRAKARQTTGDQDIAIIALHGRFPGANTVGQFWQNLCDGVESVTEFTDQQLLDAGVDPLLMQDRHYIKRRPILDDVAHFDAAFFGYTPREAELMDPQQRLFHEVAWEALELAAYDTQRFSGLVGVFAGMNISMYLLRLATDPAIAVTLDESTILENDKDALATNVAYKLNLRGPSFAVQTFCSTSLVATHLACRSLLAGECDIALAGGVSVRVPVQAGYLYQEGDQVSPDGHVRTFDALAEGATFGDGIAVVVLKRLADALADGDTVHAVIKGSAINNDGSLKVGYTAPSVVGQSAVVVSALERAGIDPRTIGYVEAHGTATKLGDPIEVASLTRAYRQFTDARNYCLIGSVKPNVGHLDRAAGVTGLIKAVHVVQTGQVPATLHFTAPNPEIDFDSSPFKVSTALQPLPPSDGPRRAAVNSLGVGGTNAHVIVEQAPALPLTSPARSVQLLLLSARSASALEAMTENLAAHLRANPQQDLADVAYTLQVGRRVFEHRRALVVRDRAEALALLEGTRPGQLWTTQQKPATRTLAFLLPGVGEHYAGMAGSLYHSEPAFRAALDQCCTLLTPLLGQDLRPLLVPAASSSSSNGNGHSNSDLRALLGRAPQSGAQASPLHQTALAQPAVFAVEYALAQLLASWGIRPSALLGYSLGEYVAATLAGVLALSDALTLVAKRAQLIQELPAGVMLAVQQGEAALQPYLGDGVELAIVNTPTMCVLGGPEAAIAAVEARLTGDEVACRRLATSHAFHTSMLAAIADELTELVETLTLRPPQVPYLSNVSGTWITAAQATDPAYWAQHMVQTVRFGAGVAALLGQGDPVLLEVGPGAGLTALVRQHPACGRARLTQVVSTLPAQHEASDAQASLFGALGRLWLVDTPLAWERLYDNEQRRRIPLPTYPFERQRFWLEPSRTSSGRIGSPVRRPDLGEWFVTSSWKRALPHDPDAVVSYLSEPRCWVLLTDSCGVGPALASWLDRQGQHVVTVAPGATFVREHSRAFTVRPDSRTDYEALLRELQAQGLSPSHVVHLWGVTPTMPDGGERPADVEHMLEHGYYSLLALTQALGNHGVDFCRIGIVSNDMQDVTGLETISPAKATLIGPCKIILQEYPNLVSRSIDLQLANAAPQPALIAQLAAELSNPSREHIVALRGPHLWVQDFVPTPLPATDTVPLRQRGVYLLTGGLGGIALGLAEHLAETYQARLVLLNRSGLPPRAEWASYLAAHPGNEDRTAERLRKVQRLEQLGGEVLVIQADVADVAQVRAAVAQTHTRFGALHGVLHTAGVPGVGLMQLKTPAAAAGVFAPKVFGTLALAAALREEPLDFLVLFSSITSATGGGPGQSDYSAANAFLDAFARKHANTFGRTVAISWGEWLWDAWSEGLLGFPEDVRAMLIAIRRAYGLSFPEGAEVLRRVLARRLPHVFVTTQDLLEMVEGSKRAAAETIAEFEEQRQERPRYPRPTLGTTYAAPRNETEQTIAAIWQNLLGIEQIGIDDNFFELGGNSLLGISLISQLRKALKLDKLPAYVLYEAPTVATMATYIGQAQAPVVEEILEDVEDQSEKRLEKLDFFKRRAHTEELL